MNKAILVMDMPKNCLYCTLSNWATCRITKKCNTGYYRPDSCPLRPLPDRKKETDASTDYEYYRMQGYNMCVDELGGAK